MNKGLLIGGGAAAAFVGLVVLLLLGGARRHDKPYAASQNPGTKSEPRVPKGKTKKRQDGQPSGNG